MMKKLVFATHNEDKVKEIKQKLKGSFEVISLAELGYFDDIPETADTLKGNALIKADTVFKKFKVDCFSDDTGLEVDFLNGAPGVYSARYAGENVSYSDNVMKLLSEMERAENRKARFRTVVVLILNGEKHFFEGTVEGKITTKIMGDGGFGYDPVFMPDGNEITFAQMHIEDKNKISHRGKAMVKLIDFLNSLC